MAYKNWQQEDYAQFIRNLIITSGEIDSKIRILEQERIMVRNLIQDMYENCLTNEAIDEYLEFHDKYHI